MLNQLQISVLVSADGRIIDPAKQAWLHASETSRIAVQLGIRDPKVVERLDSAIEEAAAVRKPGTLWWRKGGEELGSLIRVRPAREAGMAVVTISNLEEPIGQLEPRVLVEIFDFTMAEAEIAVHLFRGRNLSAIAGERGVQLETVRGQVKTILRKTGVPGQKQLMLLLSKIALIASPIAGAPSSGGLRTGASRR